MPCRYDPSPEEQREARRKAEQKRQAELDKLDHLTQQLCEARATVVALVTGKINVEDYELSNEWNRLVEDHVEHRRFDRDRELDSLMERLKKASTAEKKNEIIERMAAVSAVLTDEELLHTELF